MAMPAITDLNSQASGLFGRMKPSERRLLLVLGVAALAVIPVKALDAMEKAETRQAEVQASLERARMIARRSQGGAAGRAAAEQGEIRAWSWQAEGLDVGQVQIQNQIADMAEKAGLTEVEVKLDSKAQTVGDVTLVPLELTANFNWTGLSGFLTTLDGTGKGFVIDGVTLADDRDKPRIKVELRAPLVIASRASDTVRRGTP